MEEGLESIDRIPGRFGEDCGVEKSFAVLFYSVHQGHSEGFLQSSQLAAREAEHVLYWSGLGNERFNLDLEFHGDSDLAEGCCILGRLQCAVSQSEKHCRSD